MLAVLLFPSREPTISDIRVADVAGVSGDEPYSGNSDQLAALLSAWSPRRLHRESGVAGKKV